MEGLGALEEFLSALPAHGALAYVIIPKGFANELDPLLALIKRHWKKQICFAREAMPLEAGLLYLCPVDQFLRIENGLFKHDGSDSLDDTTALDVFLHFLALEQREQAAAILLTDGGRAGVKAIHEAGGLVLAPDGKNAPYAFKPACGDAHDFIDFTMPPGSMPAALCTYFHAAARAATLENELERTHLELRAAKEEQEAKSLELLTANEELQVSNEELQAANEELISSNEELIAINALVDQKHVELIRQANDINNLLRATDISVILLDNAMCIRRYTRKALLLFELPPEDRGVSIGHISTTLIAPEALLDDIRRVGQFGSEIEREMRTRQGAWLLSRILPYRDEEGRCDGIVLTFVDITRLRRAELSLRESEERLHYAMMAANDGLWDWELDTNQAYYSPRCYTMLGYEPDEFPSSFNAWASLLHPDDKEMVLGQMAYYTRERREGFSMEFRMYTQQGDVRWILSKGIVVARREDGIPTRMVGTFSDISDRKRAEAVVRELNTELERRVLERTAELADAIRQLGAEVRERKDAVQALRESEQRFMLAISGSNDGFWDWTDIEHDRGWWSPRMYQHLGYELGEIEPTFGSLRRRMHPDDIERADESIRLHLEENKPYDTEFRLLDKQGSYRWFRLRGQALRGEDGRPVRMSGSMQDITSLKKAHEDLRQAHASLEAHVAERTKELTQANKTLHTIRKQLEEAQRLGKIGNWEYNLETGETTWSEQLYRLFERAPAEGALSFEQTLAYYPAEDARKLQEIIESLSRQSSVFELDMVTLRPSGDQMHQHSILASEADASGRIIKLVGTVQDVTVRQSALRALESTKAELEQQLSFMNALMVALPNPVFYKDSEGRYLGCNKAFETFLGASASQIVGKTVHETWPSDIAELFWRQDKELMRKPGVLTFEFQLPSADQHMRQAISSKATFYHSDGAQAGLIGVITDITERKHSEELIRRQIEQLAQANTELEEFNYVASHDLQEPLRTIASYCELLRSDMGVELSEQADEDIRFIVEASGRMKVLVQDLLQLSRAGRKEYDLLTVDLNACVESSIKDLRRRIRETKAEITFDRLPVIRADRLQITRVIQNLLSNAIKFHHGAPPQVHISACRAAEDFWKIMVADNGIGFDPAYSEQIFIPFKRLHGRSQYEGTGIGLAICRKIVQRHGGQIWAEPVLGKGTTMCFTVLGAELKREEVHTHE